MGWFRPIGRKSPSADIWSEGTDQGIRSGGGLSRHGLISPVTDATLGDGVLGDLVAMMQAGHGIWHVSGADCRSGNKGPDRSRRSAATPLSMCRAIARTGTEGCNRRLQSPKQMRDMTAVPRGMSRYAWEE